MARYESQHRQAVAAGWTDERVEKLKAMHAEGQSSSQMAKALGGVSRNGVIGKIHRLGLAVSRAPSPPTARLGSSTRRAPPQPKPRVVVCGNNTAIAHPDRPALVPMPKSEVWKPIAGSHPRPFWERGNDFCKWPVEVEGADEGVMRCCLVAERGGHCADHALLAYGPAKSQPQRVVRDLLRTARHYG